MSYLRKFEYKILPVESYTILRHCPICGIKSSYINSNHFRVNANGNRIDVWLIYQCHTCKNTYKLSIAERVKKDDLSLCDYNGFMQNDKGLALTYGLDKSILLKNKLEININAATYQILPSYPQNVDRDEQIIYLIGDIIEIENPYGLKLRSDKLLSELLQISRKKAMQLERSGVITFHSNPGQNLEIIMTGDIYHEASV